MQPLAYQHNWRFRIGVPLSLPFPKSTLLKICLDGLKMAGGVLFAALATLVMWL